MIAFDLANSVGKSNAVTSTDPLGTRNVSQCRFEICSHVFVGFQVFRGMPLFRSRLCHALSYIRSLRATPDATPITSRS
jgi:hypothetical protein